MSSRPEPLSCCFRNERGEGCASVPEPGGRYCFWHETEGREAVVDLVKRLEARARTQQTMIGFNLDRADLHDVDLVNHQDRSGYQLREANLYRANLRNAHLFHIDLRGSNLMKADLAGANLNCADLRGANLLGIKLESAKLDNIRWGERLLQERMAQEAQERQERLDLYEQAEEIYRSLRKAMESRGMFETAGLFFQREMVTRRYQMPLFSFRRFFSKVVDLFCGYGERPLRVVCFSLMLILVFALVYALLGVMDAGEPVRFSADLGWGANLQVYLDCTYMSVVTFTTLGYGDMTPLGFARFAAATEAFIGSFTLALFVVVFVKKMTR